MFVDVDLTEKRASQRLKLRSVPGWVMDRVVVPTPNPFELEPDQVVLAERRIRDMADRFVTDPEIVEYLDKGLRFETALAAGGVLKYLSDPGRHQAGPLVVEIEEEIEANYNGDWPDGLADRLIPMIWLLAYADKLADDGYADRRIKFGE